MDRRTSRLRCGKTPRGSSVLCEQKKAFRTMRNETLGWGGRAPFFHFLTKGPTTLRRDYAG